MPNGALTYSPGAITEEDPNKISVGAQDIAKAQGVSYEDIATTTAEQELPQYQEYGAADVGETIGERVAFKPSESYIDAAKSTVAGQLTTLLGAESPYIKQARAQAQEQAQARGLLNTTLAAQAGQEAAIRAGLPIAQADAATYAKFAQQQQAAEQNLATIQAEGIISAEMVEQKAAIDQQNQNINNAFQAKLTGATEQSKVWLNDMQQQHDVNMQNLNVQAQQMLTEMEVDFKVAAGVRDNAASIMQNYQISVENMLTDPDFLQLGSEAVNKALNELQAVASNSIGFIGASAGVDMDAFLDEYMAPIEAL